MIEFSRIKRPLTFIALLVALIALGFIFRYNLQAPAAPSGPGPSGSVPVGGYIPTAADTVKSLLKRSKIAFPQISRETKILFSQLPAELQPLANIADSEGEVSRVVYADNRNGFKIEYSVNSSMDDINRFLLNKTDSWVLLAARKGYAAALIERQSPDFQIRILQRVFDSSSSSVSIQVINIK